MVTQLDSAIRSCRSITSALVLRGEEVLVVERRGVSVRLPT